MKRYEILNEAGEVENTILAPDDTFLQENFENWRLADVQPEPELPPESWLISVGAWFDRFGIHKWEILADPDPMLQALVKDCLPRKHIDLKRPDLVGALAYVRAKGYPVGDVLSTPCQPGEAPA